MSERLTSFFILLGAVLVMVVLWYLSVIVVRRDTRRRGMQALQRKAWIVAAVVLPLFGFALYLFVHVLHDYLSPVPQQEQEPDVVSDPNRVTASRPISETSDQASGNGKVHDGAALISNTGTIGRAAYGRDDAGRNRTPTTIPAPYRAVQGRFLLAILEGPLVGQQFMLDQLPLRIGRGPEAGLSLDADLNVSRSHAELYEWNGALRIRDLGSTHGTQVNGVPVSDQAIYPGDHISVGGTKFILRELP